ncbi:hypothetical protein [Bacillus sp. 2205SS5-2]|uniref:hypothetical protein n=1 Tax=Bacillus sp. 2205SS5-2 TaxID=3109031 RepID=UPI00300752E6
MKAKQLEEMFDYYGYDDLYQRLKYPISISGILEEVEEDQLEDFFQEFSFDERPLFFDEFKYWISLFLMYRKNFHPEMLDNDHH